MEGKEKWSIPIDIPQNPVVDQDGTIYTSSYMDEMSGLGSMNNGTLLAINPDGSVKWKYESEGMFTEPVLDDNGNIFTTNYSYTSSETNKDLSI